MAGAIVNIIIQHYYILFVDFKTKMRSLAFVSTGTAPGSSKFGLPICTVFAIEIGLITKDFTYYDNFEE
jgi:hypothetical protein